MRSRLTTCQQHTASAHGQRFTTAQRHCCSQRFNRSWVPQHCPHRRSTPSHSNQRRKPQAGRFPGCRCNVDVPSQQIRVDNTSLPCSCPSTPLLEVQMTDRTDQPGKHCSDPSPQHCIAPGHTLQPSSSWSPQCSSSPRYMVHCTLTAPVPRSHRSSPRHTARCTTRWACPQSHRTVPRCSWCTATSPRSCTCQRDKCEPSLTSWRVDSSTPLSTDHCSWTPSVRTPRQSDLRHKGRCKST